MEGVLTHPIGTAFLGTEGLPPALLTCSLALALTHEFREGLWDRVGGWAPNGFVAGTSWDSYVSPTPHAAIRFLIFFSISCLSPHSCCGGFAHLSPVLSEIITDMNLFHPQKDSPPSGISLIWVFLYPIFLMVFFFFLSNAYFSFTSLFSLLGWKQRSFAPLRCFFVFNFPSYFFIFSYLVLLERVGEGGAEGERENPKGVEPDAGLDLKTLRP